MDMESVFSHKYCSIIPAPNLDIYFCMDFVLSNTKECIYSYLPYVKQELLKPLKRPECTCEHYFNHTVKYNPASWNAALPCRHQKATEDCCGAFNYRTACCRPYHGSGDKRQGTEIGFEITIKSPLTNWILHVSVLRHNFQQY